MFDVLYGTGILVLQLKIKNMHLEVCQKAPLNRFDEDVIGNCGVYKTRISSLKGFLRHVSHH